MRPSKGRCYWCGAGLVERRRHAKWCSASCRTLASRERRTWAAGSVVTVLARYPDLELDQLRGPVDDGLFRHEEDFGASFDPILQSLVAEGSIACDPESLTFRLGPTPRQALSSRRRRPCYDVLGREAASLAEEEE